jgi:hypothetical protein
MRPPLNPGKAAEVVQAIDDTAVSLKIFCPQRLNLPQIQTERSGKDALIKLLNKPGGNAGKIVARDVAPEHTANWNRRKIV